jgi:hypothetical protein
VWFAWGAENDEIEVPKKSAETGGHPCVLFYQFSDHLFLQRDGCIKLLWLLFPSNHSNCFLLQFNAVSLSWREDKNM